jgi:hypothetical protein
MRITEGHGERNGNQRLGGHSNGGLSFRFVTKCLARSAILIFSVALLILVLSP